MKQYQKIFLLLFLLMSARLEFVIAQSGTSCDEALPVSAETGNVVNVSFQGQPYSWLSIQTDTPGVVLALSPEGISDVPNIESIDLYYGSDCNNKTLLWSQHYADTDSAYVSEMILVPLEESAMNYYLKVNKLQGYGDEFTLTVNGPNLQGGCSPGCDNLVANGDFSVINVPCVNDANTHSCPDPFNLNCVCGWGSTHGTPQLNGSSVTMGIWGGWGEGIYQNLANPVVPGRNYLLSFNHIRYSSGTNINLFAQFTNSTFSPGPCFELFPPADWNVPTSPVWANSNSWKTSTICFSPNATYSRLRFYPSSIAFTREWVGIDNVKLIELDAPIPDQTITCSEEAVLSQPCPSTDPRIRYAWSTGQTTASISVRPTVTTTYTLTVYVVVSNITICNFDIPATVYVNPMPPPILSAGSTVLCQMNSTETYCFLSANATQFNCNINPVNSFVPNGSCIDVTWNNFTSNCATIEVTAIAAGCTPATAVFDVCALCQGNPVALTFCDALASDILSNPLYASYISGGNIFRVPAGQWATFHGVTVIDVPFIIDNSDIRFGPDAEVLVNPSQVLEIRNQSHLHSCDGVNMWESIHVADPSALVYIHDGNNLIEDAECAIQSVNGGNFQVNSATFRDNLTGIYAYDYNGVHPGKIAGCTFTGTGTLLNPYSNWCTQAFPHTGVRVHNVKNIQIGEPGQFFSYGRNIFENLYSGIFCSISNADIYTSEFNSMIDPPGDCTPPEGCGIYAYGLLGIKWCTINIGGQTIAEQCIFNSCTYGIREKNEVHGEIKYNKFTNCETGIYNASSSRFNNLVKGNVFDDYVRGVYFTNAINQIQYGLEIYENLFNTNLTSFNIFTYGVEAINVSNTFSSSTNLWVVGNVINYTRTGVFARNIWEPCNIRSNTINFDILPADAQMMGIHHGIQCENDNGLQIDNNFIRWRNQPSPPSGFVNKMNGITINFSSNTTNTAGGIFENKIGPYPAANTGSTYGLGSGINISNQCMGLTLYCNKMNRCEEGVTFRQANLGPQGYRDQSQNWHSNGNTFVYTPSQGGYRLAGTVIQSIEWPYVNQNENPNPFYNNVVVDFATAFSAYQCLPPSPMEDENRDDMFGMLVSNDPLPINPDYSGYEEQIRYAAKEKFYEAVKEDSTMLDAGVAEDLAYENLYEELESSNIAKFREVKTSIDSLDFTEASQKLSLLVDTNFAEHNKKVVMNIFLETFANDMELDSSHRALLEPISLLHPLIGGEGVFWACAMLDVPVNNELAPLRKANPGSWLTETNLKEVHVFPNPVTDELQVSYHSEVPLSLVLTDVTGKQILTSYLDAKNETGLLNVSMIDAGTYFLKVTDGSTMVFTEKLVIIR